MKNKMSVADAQQGSDNMQMAGIGAKAFDSLANSQRQPLPLENRMQDLGRAPSMIEQAQQKTDVSGLQQQADHKLQQARSDESDAVKMAFEQKKAELMQQVADKRLKQGLDIANNKQKFDAEQKQLDRAHAEKLAGMKSRDVDPVVAMIKSEQLKKIQNENNTPVDPFKLLPKDNQETITELSKKNANKESIANQIDAMIAQADLAKDDDAKLAIYRQMGKVLNSTEGSDAVGAEEAKRLMSKLEFAMGNIFNENPVQFGRDLPGFKDQAIATSKSVRDSQKANQAVIDQKYGRKTAKTPVKKQYSASRNQTKVIYSDGSEELLDGQQ
jgi:hypothetical protein